MKKNTAFYIYLPMLVSIIVHSQISYAKDYDSTFSLLTGQHWQNSSIDKPALSTETVNHLKAIAHDGNLMNIYRFRALLMLSQNNTEGMLQFLNDYADRYQDYPSHVAAAFDLLCSNYADAEESLQLAVRLLDHDRARIRIMAARFLNQHNENHPALADYKNRDLKTFERQQAFKK